MCKYRENEEKRKHSPRTRQEKLKDLFRPKKTIHISENKSQSTI